MGISKARGSCWPIGSRGATAIYVLTGDGELQEGQFWESLQPTVNHGMHEITVIVDHNKMQSDTLGVERVSDLGDLEAKFAAFGWDVDRCDGHDLADARSGRWRGLCANSGGRQDASSPTRSRARASRS